MKASGSLKKTCIVCLFGFFFQGTRTCSPECWRNQTRSSSIFAHSFCLYTLACQAEMLSHAFCLSSAFLKFALQTSRGVGLSLCLARMGSQAHWFYDNNIICLVINGLKWLFCGFVLGRKYADIILAPFVTDGGYALLLTQSCYCRNWPGPLFANLLKVRPQTMELRKYSLFYHYMHVFQTDHFLQLAGFSSRALSFFPQLFLFLNMQTYSNISLWKSQLGHIPHIEPPYLFWLAECEITRFVSGLMKN